MIPPPPDLVQVASVPAATERYQLTTAVGPVWIEAVDAGITAAGFGVSPWPLTSADSTIIRHSVAWIMALLDGATAPTREIPVLLSVSAFRWDIYRHLITVRAGTTISYGELARCAGRQGAARAVGSAMRSNPVPLFIPCHRVVAAGGLGGFSGGLEIKNKLLTTEQRLWG